MFKTMNEDFLVFLDRRMPRLPRIPIDIIHDPDRPWRERQALLLDANRAFDWGWKIESSRLLLEGLDKYAFDGWMDRKCAYLDAIFVHWFVFLFRRES